MPPEEVRVPIFPLGGVVLFPHTRQLLHIFEPRYRQMTEDALAGDGRIGMVLPRQNEAPTPREPVPIFTTGCLGQITASRKLPDGRFLILLEGRTRFEVQAEESTSKLYRVVRARLLPEPEFEELEPEARAALEAARTDLESKMLELTTGLEPERIDALGEQMQLLDPIQLIHALAFGLECPGVEKQVLLETSGPLERCRRLIDLLAFRIAESRWGDKDRILN